MHSRKGVTFFDDGAARLERLCSAVGLGGDTRRIVELFDRLTASWGKTPIGEQPRWPSEVGDDHTPYEFSLALSQTPELRIMVEPLGAAPSLAANAQASLALLAELAGSYEIDLRRLEKVRDLFLPREPKGLFAMWVAAGFAHGRAPEFKIYLNPDASGPGRATAVIEEMLTRLGFETAWPRLARSLLRRGLTLDELKYVSLDLTPTAEARIKIYARHHRVAANDLELAASAAPSYQRGDATRFLQLVAPPGDQVLSGRGLWTCLSYVEGDDRPAAVTHHFPINGYAPNDAVASERIAACLARLELPAETYKKTIAAYADRPLERGIGLQSYVSFRRDRGQPRVTVYLPAEAYRPGTVAQPNAPRPPADLAGLVDHFEHNGKITDHPFMQRLGREPVSLPHLYTLLANFQISISKHFAGHLARLTARASDDRVRCILAEQLSDEMGRGDFEKAHTRLFIDMMKKLERWRPAIDPQPFFKPGHNLTPKLQAIYDAEEHEALGAIMAGEVFGKQMDLFIGEQFRRQRELDPESLEWLTLHEQLEVEHADGSMVLARVLPKESLERAWRGATTLSQAGWEFLDDLYEVCYGGGAILRS